LGASLLKYTYPYCKRNARANYVRKVLLTDEDPMSINDNLPSSSPSGKTTLKLLAAVLAFVVLVALYYNIIGF
jgi:hypothetical protein